MCFKRGEFHRSMSGGLLSKPHMYCGILACSKLGWRVSGANMLPVYLTGSPASPILTDFLLL